MLLMELCENIGKTFMVDELLKIYCYKDRMEFIDYTPEYDLPNGDKISESYGHFLTLNLKDNKISCIENSSLGLITPGNKNMIAYLLTLVGEEVEDYDDYKKLDSIKDLDCINISMI